MDHARLRDEFLPLPTAEDGYQRVLMLGTTGAGKTTVVRQLLGTHPRTERFPSTSTSKTTVADTEIIPADDPTYRAVVTFMPEAEIRDHLLDNVQAACRAILDGADDFDVFLKLLDHEAQRFRLSYLLGRPVIEDEDDLIEDELEPEAEDDTEAEQSLPAVDIEATRQVVQRMVASLRYLVSRVSTVATLSDSGGNGDSGDEEAFLVEFQEQIAWSSEVDEVIDALVAEVQKRFDALPVGTLVNGEDGWPEVWFHESGDRRQFLRDLSAFYSNASQSFGRLLTPVVSGMRVRGPFIPAWSDRPLRLVIVDSEGLGHTPSSIASLSSPLVRKVAECDAVLVVDNAEQPMLAGPLAALTQIVETGNVAKLHLLFTHLDGVNGPNLAGYKARVDHVRESVDNAIRGIESTTSAAAARSLARRAQTSLYFAGKVDRVLNGKDTFVKRSAQEFTRLTAALEREGAAQEQGDAQVVVSRRGVVLAVKAAAERFQSEWLVRIGADRAGSNGVRPEHWSRIKALTRRVARLGEESYQDLKPVADFRGMIQHELWGMLQDPVRWDGQMVSDDEKAEIVDSVANAMSLRVMDLASRRVIENCRQEWEEAFALNGKGSTTNRTRILADDVVTKCAAIPTSSLTSEAAALVSELEALLDKVAVDYNLVLE